MKELITIAFLLIGAIFMFLAALGILKMPDLFTRMQAVTKASTLGITFLIMAVAVHFADLGITTRAVLVIVFFFLTTPVAAHVIGRAAYFEGVPLWENTIMDDLRERYRERQDVPVDSFSENKNSDPLDEDR